MRILKWRRQHGIDNIVERRLKHHDQFNGFWPCWLAGHDRDGRLVQGGLEIRMCTIRMRRHVISQVERAKEIDHVGLVKMVRRYCTVTTVIIAIKPIFVVDIFVVDFVVQMESGVSLEEILLQRAQVEWSGMEWDGIE